MGRRDEMLHEFWSGERQIEDKKPDTMFKLIKKLDNGMIRVGRKFYQEVSEDIIAEEALQLKRFAVSIMWLRHKEGVINNRHTLSFVTAKTKDEAIEATIKANTNLTKDGYALHTVVAGVDVK